MRRKLVVELALVFVAFLFGCDAVTGPDISGSITAAETKLITVTGFFSGPIDVEMDTSGIFEITETNPSRSTVYYEGRFAPAYGRADNR